MTRVQRAKSQIGIPEPVLEFKICPGLYAKRKFWWTVKIFATRGKMRRYLRFIRPDRDTSKTWAFTNNEQDSQEIIFCLWTMTDQTVAHESYHAVAWWLQCNRKNDAKALSWDRPEHEEAAEALGSLVSQIWENFTKAGFSRDQCW